jgi:hypothetical protein
MNSKKRILIILTDNLRRESEKCLSFVFHPICSVKNLLPQMLLLMLRQLYDIYSCLLYNECGLFLDEIQGTDLDCFPWNNLKIFTFLK